jgi:hypothetical protein
MRRWAEVSRLVVLAFACGGCQLVFELQAPDDAVLGPCTPGKLPAVMAGGWEAGAVDGNGTMYVGYRDAASERLFVQAIDARGALAAIPRSLTDGPEGESLRMFGHGGAASLSFELVLDGFSAVVAHTITETALSDRSRLTGPGNQCSSSVTLVRNDRVFAAYRDEITSDPPVYKTIVDLLDSSLTPVGQVSYDFEELGGPQQLVATTNGYLVHTTDADARNLYPLDVDGQVTGAPMPIGGADLITLVESTPEDRPMLARATGGGVELVALSLDGAPTDSTIVTAGGVQVTALATRSTSTGTLVLWQDQQLRVSRVTADGPTEPAIVSVDGANPVARAIVQGAAGPIVYVERGPDAGPKEIVAVQACGL